MSVVIALACVEVGMARAPLPGSELQKLVDDAVASGAKDVLLPPGDYLFNVSRSNFRLHNAVHLNVIATGVTVWLWPGNFVDIKNSQSSSMVRQNRCTPPCPGTL